MTTHLILVDERDGRGEHGTVTGAVGPRGANRFVVVDCVREKIRSIGC